MSFQTTNCLMLLLMVFSKQTFNPFKKHTQLIDKNNKSFDQPIKYCYAIMQTIITTNNTKIRNFRIKNIKKWQLFKIV
jgi:hypothetical protein